MRVVMLLTFFVTAQAFAQSNVLPNGDFATDIAGWSYTGDPPGAISWESSDGDPSPGSLRLTASAPGGLREAKPTACAGVGPGEIWTVEARAKREPTVSCSIQLLSYSGPGCTGLESTWEPFPNAGTPGTWTALTQAAPLGQVGEQSVTLRLLLSHDDPDSATCLFDSVRLYGTSSVVEVPAAGGWGLAVLALLLGASAIAILRR